MNVFVTGASGYIGSAVVRELLDAGHSVTGLARSDASAARLTAAGVGVHRGDLDDLDSLRSGAAAADGVIHLAFNHDFTRFEASVRDDGLAIAAMGDALAGTDKPLVIAAGTPAIEGRVSTELDDPEDGGPAGARNANAAATVALASRGVRSSVVRLPRSVHGDGDRSGFISLLIAFDRERGVSAYIGDGSNRWPAVHRIDAAHLFRLALERAPAGSVLHAVGDEGVPIRDIADVIGRRLGLPMESVAADDLGFLGAVLARDQPASSELTRELLGWQPTQPGLLDDLDQEHYFPAAVPIAR